MNRFQWDNGKLHEEENFVVSQTGVGLYDGDVKSAFQEGTLILTTFHLRWRDALDASCQMALELKWVERVRHEAGGMMKSPKLILQLHPVSTFPDLPVGPLKISKANHIKLSFRRTGEKSFLTSLQEALNAKCWLVHSTIGNASTPRAVGILGIERKREQKHKSTDASINLAFEDLEQLMAKAKDMVKLTQAISSKLKEKGDTENSEEDSHFKAQLMCLGIPDPVTRVSHRGTYSQELAKELAAFLEKTLRSEHQRSDSSMTLADAYCRVNRARGMALLSPDDMLEACKLMSQLRLPVQLVTFESGVMVLRLSEHNDKAAMSRIVELLKARQSISVDGLARHLGISAILAKEQLLHCERQSHVCRDDSIEGLRFYPNYFLQRD